MGSTTRVAQSTTERLRIHRRIHRFIAWSLLLLATSVAVAHFLPGSSSDSRKFDQKRWTVARVVDGDSFHLADTSQTRVGLLGVDAPDLPDSHFATQALGYLRGRIEGKIILLKLDGTQSRDSNGRLLAYVYITDTDLLNADIIRDGRGYSDRLVKHTFRPQFDQAENEARAKARGLWDEITDERMPPWRQRWLETLPDRR